VITLWHCDDARSFRALWALEELGLDYSLKMLPFPPRLYQKEYLSENPLGTIPLLVDGDTRLTESSAIPHYLSVKYGNGRFARQASDSDYGDYLNWVFHGEATLTFPQTIFIRYTMMETPERRQPSVGEDYRKWFLARLRLTEQTLEDGRSNLLETGFSNADISVGYAILLANIIGLGEDVPPNTRTWYESLTNREGFKRAQHAQDEELAKSGFKKSSEVFSSFSLGRAPKTQP